MDWYLMEFDIIIKEIVLVRGDGFMLSKEFFAEKLVKTFPEKEQNLKNHYTEYGELLGHIFFDNEITTSLIKLLKNDSSDDEINYYCDFIEEMWRSGDKEVFNIVYVSILERLSEDEKVWVCLGKHFGDDFIDFINDDLLVNNIMMRDVPRL